MRNNFNISVTLIVHQFIWTKRLSVVFWSNGWIRVEWNVKICSLQQNYPNMVKHMIQWCIRFWIVWWVNIEFVSTFTFYPHTHSKSSRERWKYIKTFIDRFEFNIRWSVFDSRSICYTAKLWWIFAWAKRWYCFGFECRSCGRLEGTTENIIIL